MTRRRPSLALSERGATLPEFAFIAPVMFVMLMGFLDVVHQAYARSLLNGVMQKAGRDSTLESGAGTASNAALDAKIRTEMRGLTGPGATYAPERLAYSDFSQVDQPEVFIDKIPLNRRYDAGECFEDQNGNGQWDADMGRGGQGGAQDVVLYRMTVTYPRLFPMAGLIGLPENAQINASTVLRNQPYRAQIRPLVRPCT